MSMQQRGVSRSSIRVPALLFALVLALSLLLSAAFVLAERHHNCTDEHCEICAAVAHSVSLLKLEHGAAMPLPVLAVALFAALGQVFVPVRRHRVAQSLVSLKVKLSD